MGLGTMNMCFTAFASARAAIHRIVAILDEPRSATSQGLRVGSEDLKPERFRQCLVKLREPVTIRNPHALT